MIEAVLHVIHVNALGWLLITGIEDIGDELVNWPDMLMESQGKQAIRDFKFISELGICDVPGRIQKL